ncbi:MAG: GDSL-type esterase/lipase family protein [Prevotellaceae bacterium]|nr:GDSL-type esterase/lipase family protein [Prevotellaceae bacterium]MDY6099491.1 GDSL-type esterase/lipase family protein [Bacteroidaceae bacterium]
MKKNNTMKILLMAGFAMLSLPACAQKHHEFANYKRYAEKNLMLGKPAKGEKRVVLFGNSITDGWPSARPEFFRDNNLIGRGISGQTSYQFLLRFREDVINLGARIVVINYGTNDIAENTGPYDEDITFGNIKSMVDIARANKVKVILASCLPAGGFGWRPSIKDSMAKIRSLNARVQAYAKAEKIPYVDYFSAMVSADGKELRPDYANDRPGVHPNVQGYAVMEQLLLPVIRKLR